MHPKPRHVTQQLEAYLDDQLLPQERRRVDEHLAECPRCAQRFYEAQRVKSELGPVLKTALGQPVPSSALRHRVRKTLEATNTPRRLAFPWAASGRVLNAVGTTAIIALLALGAFVVIRGQLSTPDNISLAIQSLRSYRGGNISTAAPTSTLTPVPSFKTTPEPVFELSSQGDTLPRFPLPLVPSGAEQTTISRSPSAPSRVMEEKGVLRQETQDPVPGPQLARPEPPDGLIAFSIFNSAPDHQFYETHLIQPNGSNHLIFPLSGVSEPALSTDGKRMAFRAWSEPTSPRSLLSSDLEGAPPHRVGGFWEDAQPDWSPTEYRLIFASQREVDRRWRLYTSWGDGSNEINLRREGRSPTFAPDGNRFAFESCDETGNRCGLWLGDLENSEYASYPFLEDPLARSPDWSPVGEQIAYMANPNGNWDLYLVESGGGKAHRLTTHLAVDGLPVWSPDGEWLAFLSNRGGEWGIWLLHIETGQTRQVTSLPGASVTPPERSPYGQRNWWDEQLSWSW